MGRKKKFKPTGENKWLTGVIIFDIICLISNTWVVLFGVAAMWNVGAIVFFSLAIAAFYFSPKTEFNQTVKYYGEKFKVLLYT